MTDAEVIKTMRVAGLITNIQLQTGMINDIMQRPALLAYPHWRGTLGKSIVELTRLNVLLQEEFEDEVSSV